MKRWLLERGVGWREVGGGETEEEGEEEEDQGLEKVGVCVETA